MAIFRNFFKKTKETRKPAELKNASKDAPEDALKDAPEKRNIKQEENSADMTVLLSPHITEKGTIIAGDNQYVFKVSSSANKLEVKKAVEDIYKVNVVGVNVINIPAKQKRMGRNKGWIKGYKKAIIKIKQGQKIEVSA